MTWSPQIIISGSAAFCTVGSSTPGDPNACDQDQGSHPVVGADGALYVIFGNGNVPGAGQGQVLMVRCPAPTHVPRRPTGKDRSASTPLWALTQRVWRATPPLPGWPPMPAAEWLPRARVHVDDDLRRSQ